MSSTVIGKRGTASRGLAPPLTDQQGRRPVLKRKRRNEPADAPAPVEHSEAAPSIRIEDDSREAEVQHLKSHCINPAAKIKKDTQFEFSTVLDRLKNVGADGIYPVDHVDSPMSTFPDINVERVNLHGIDKLAFPNLEYNPHAPVVPGAPGLFFVSSTAKKEPWVCKVFTPWKGDRTWGYMGDYMFIPVPSLSPTEYAMQSPAVQNNWAKNILHRDWGKPVVTRIYLRRKLTKDPTSKDIDRLMKKKDFDSSIRSAVSIEDIMTAYLTGKEEIGVYCMKCIKYDTEWQRFLCKAYPGFLRDEEERREKRLVNKATKGSPKVVKRRKVKGKAP